MTEDERIEIDWMALEASRLGLHLRSHMQNNQYDALVYIQEMKRFPGRPFQASPPSLGKYMTIKAAQEFLRLYRAAFPGGRINGQAKKG
jgi:hypothetical protein